METQGLDHNLSNIGHLVQLCHVASPHAKAHARAGHADNDIYDARDIVIQNYNLDHCYKI
jgi:hypothetical protein